MDFKTAIEDIRAYQLSLIEEDTKHKRITIDEDKIDIYRQFDPELIPDFKPDVRIEPYHTIRRVALDIETTGLDPSEHEIKTIGISYLDSSNSQDIEHMFFIYGTDTQGLRKYRNIRFYETEDEMIEASLRYLLTIKKDPYTILEFHNGWSFDIPFIEERCRYWGINLFQNMFWKPPFETTDNTAQMFGKPSRYQSYYCRGFELVDTMHKALSWDFVARSLTGGVGLKNIVYELGIEDEPRVELEYWEMLECYKKDDWKLLLSYLKDDLIATLKLGDYLLPPYYYQLQLLPHWRLQALFTRGNASKWNDILLRGYCPHVSSNPKEAKKELEIYKNVLESKGVVTDERRSFKGGKTDGTAGLFYNVGKIDVASLYPSIILNYGICSRKDTSYYLLSVLKYAWEERIRNKEIAYRDKEADMLQGSLKVLINSGYGALGTSGIIFNDYKMAALVTAYGRAILNAMDRAIVEYGGRSIELDTDGIYFSFEGDHSKLLDYVQSKMPKGIVLENEMFAKGAYIPPHKFEPSKYDIKMDLEEYPGMRKNYILVGLKLPKGKTKDIKVSGKFRNRYVPQLYKEYIPGLVQEIVETCYGLPENERISVTLKIMMRYYCSYLRGIETGKIDPKKLMIVRKAKQSKDGKRDLEKSSRENGCIEIDKNGVEICKYFYANKPGKKKPYTQQTYPVSSLKYFEKYDDIRYFYLQTLIKFTDTLSIFVTNKKISDQAKNLMLY